MRWLVARVSVMVGLLAVLLVFVRLIGGFNQSNISAIFDEGSKLPQACWRGICPYQHNLNQVETMLRANPLATKFTLDGNRSVCWYDAANPSWFNCANRFDELGAGIEVNQIQLDLPISSTFEFGDAILFLGQPLKTYLCILGKDRVRVGLMWENGITIIGASIQDPREPRFRTDTKIWDVVYHRVAFYANNGYWKIWHGFGRAKDEVEDCRY
jgi:hypothetical protein